MTGVPVSRMGPADRMFGRLLIRGMNVKEKYNQRQYRVEVSVSPN